MMRGKDRGGEHHTIPYRGGTYRKDLCHYFTFLSCRGGWQGNARHGHGMMTYPDGRIYEGQWVEDSREGFGTLTYPGVSRQYAGEWENDRRDGYGVMLYGRDSSYEVMHSRHVAETGLAPDLTHSSGPITHLVFQGEWWRGARQGWGRMVYASGDYFEGEWEAGLRHGEGVLVYANGNVYEGEWEGDKKEGKGRFSHASGVIQVFLVVDANTNYPLFRMDFGWLTA